MIHYTMYLTASNPDVILEIDPYVPNSFIQDVLTESSDNEKSIVRMSVL